MKKLWTIHYSTVHPLSLLIFKKQRHNRIVQCSDLWGSALKFFLTFLLLFFCLVLEMLLVEDWARFLIVKSSLDRCSQQFLIWQCYYLAYTTTWGPFRPLTPDWFSKEFHIAVKLAAIMFGHLVKYELKFIITQWDVSHMTNFTALM